VAGAGVKLKVEKIAIRSAQARQLTPARLVWSRGAARRRRSFSAIAARRLRRRTSVVAAAAAAAAAATTAAAAPGATTDSTRRLGGAVLIRIGDRRKRLWIERWLRAVRAGIGGAANEHTRHAHHEGEAECP